MTQDPETLTGLVADRVGRGREMTYRVFEERAVDPETQHRPSRSLLWRIGNGETFMPTPMLVRAVAAGLRLPLARVQAAAAYQTLGLVTERVGDALILRTAGEGEGNGSADEQSKEA